MREVQKQLKWYYWVGMVILGILGAVTLVPFHAFQRNLIGYYSLGPVAPITAIVLWTIAGEIYWFGKNRERLPEF